MSFPYLQRSIAVGTSSTNAYAANQTIGGLNQIQNVPSGMFIQAVTITTKSCNTGQMDFLPFNSSMPNTTFSDHSSIAISSQDVGSVMSPIHITDWTALGTPYVGTANGLAYVYQVPSNAPPSLYFALVTRGTPTLASSADVQVTVTFVS